MYQAYKPPMIPGNAALATNALSFSLFVLMPSTSAASSSSRIDSRRSPKRELSTQ
jgi:hypothetical protein